MRVSHKWPSVARTFDMRVANTHIYVCSVLMRRLYVDNGVVGRRLFVCVAFHFFFIIGKTIYSSVVMDAACSLYTHD